MKALALSVLLAMATVPLLAQQEDAEGCKDSAVLSRMKSCWIDSCDKKDFDKAMLRTGPDSDQAITPQTSVEGSVETIIYKCTDNVSFLAMARNAENALKSAGLTIVFSGPGYDGTPTVTARKGGLWVSVEPATNGGQTYTQTIVRSQQMEQQMAATAEEWETSINATGSCSIYGVLFDSGKSSIQPSSTTCLNEMAKLLKKNTAWKMQVEGHTDNVGGKEANLKLSQARAEAVRTWLIAHGVAADRLVAKGFGETKPVVPNSDEQGRSKNRRVDLRKL